MMCGYEDSGNGALAQHFEARIQLLGEESGDLRGRLDGGQLREARAHAQPATPREGLEASRQITREIVGLIRPY